MLLCLLLQVLRQLDRHDEYVAFVRVFYSHIRRAPVEVLYGWYGESERAIESV